MNQGSQVWICGGNQGPTLFDAQEPCLGLIDALERGQAAPGAIIADALVVERVIQRCAQDGPYAVGARFSTTKVLAVLRVGD